MSAEVRVGIVSWNTAAALRRCLEALPAALGSLETEVVVVDNASADDSAAVVREHGFHLVPNERNHGYGVAMNQALAGTEAPVLIALNPDTEPAPGTLERLVAVLRAQPTAGVVVPRLVGADGRPQHSAYRFPTSVPSLAAAVAVAPLRAGPVGRRLLLEGSGPHRDGPVPWAIGAVHVIRVAALEAGKAPYSERSFMYAEDLDLCWRLAQRGWSTWLAADVEVRHVGNLAGAQAWGADRSLRYWSATYDVVAQRRSPAAARRLGVGAAVASLLAAARAVARSLRGGAAGAAARAEARELLRVARLHAAAARHGPPPPPTTPPGSLVTGA